MRYAPKSSSVNVSCKELSRLFTELISEKNREIFGNPQKVITTFRKKADKIRGFHQKSRDNFLQIFRKSENSSRKCRAKSRDNFFSETDIKSFFCDKVIKLFKPLMRYAPKSSSVNVSCKELSRLFTELISEKNREIFGNPQKVITTFL